MGRIRGTNTKPEIIVRRLLHALGFRFRLHSKNLPGRPDMVLRKFKTVIFVHGCFWHRHPACEYSYTPKSRVVFWDRKFRENVARDKRNQASLAVEGWRVEIIWECETQDTYEIERRIANIFSEFRAEQRVADR